MSYELYHHLLTDGDAQPVEPAIVLEALTASEDLSKVAATIPIRNVKTFVTRCARGGLDRSDLEELFGGLRTAGDLAERRDRLRFIGRCAERAMERKAKQRWGLKCSNHFEDYLEVWPEAKFLNLLRDGRDVLASQLKLGTFNTTPQKLGQRWSNVHRRFRRFCERNPDRGRFVKYERLVSDPENETRQICDFLGLDYTEQMLSFHRKDLSIFKASHLSMERISKPIDATQVGRWKQELDSSQVDGFFQTAGEEMARHYSAESS